MSAVAQVVEETMESNYSSPVGSKIEDELIAVSGVEPVAKDTRHNFLKQVIQKILDADEELMWNKLSDQAQVWVVDSHNTFEKAGTPCPFPDATSVDDNKVVVLNGSGSILAGTKEAKPNPKAPKVRGRKKAKNVFGRDPDTKAGKAMAMMLKGATMDEMFKATGGKHYVLIEKLKAEGHKVVKDGQKYTVTPKA
jgi:hypothetical protein